MMISAENRDYLNFSPSPEDGGGGGGGGLKLKSSVTHSHTRTSANNLTDIFRNVLLVAQKIGIINCDFLDQGAHAHYTLMMLYA